MIRPTLREAQELAASGDYRMIPVSRELYADGHTPIGVLRRLKAVSSHCYMLESAERDKRWGRYTFLGYAPILELTCQDGRIRVRRGGETTEETGAPGDAVRRILAAHKSPRLPFLPPFAGGLVGYFAYEYIRYAEPSLRLDAPDEEQFRDMDLMLFDKVIAFDHYRQKIVLIAHARADALPESYRLAQEELEAMAQLLRTGAPAAIPRPVLKTPPVPLFSREEYAAMVEKAKGYIREGDIFQVVLSNRLTADMEGSLFDVYRVLRASNPSPYMFYFSSDDLEAAGASPETLVKVEDGRVTTFPLAGTRPRGETDEADRALEAALLADEKELAEHNMLVDLGRNDIGKIAAGWRRGGTPWTPSGPSCRRAPCPALPKSAPAKSSASWKTTSGGCTAGPSAIWILPATWTPASPSAWPLGKTGGSSSVPGRASWPTAYRIKNIRNA